MNVHFEDTQRIRYASVQNSQLLKTQITAISNIISNYICAADTINKILKVDTVQTINEEFPCADLVTYLIPNTSQRARQGFHSQAHSVQFSVLLFSLLKKPQLFYIRTPSICEPPRGKDTAQSRHCKLIPRYITQAVLCWLTALSSVSLGVEHKCLALFMGLRWMAYEHPLSWGD